MLDRAFRGSDAVAAGLVTWHQLRGPGYVRYFPDVYLAAGAPATLRMRSLAAYELVARRGGVLAGWSAAILLGVAGAPPAAPAEVLVDYDQRAHRGLAVRRGRAERADVRDLVTCRVTAPRRTAWDLARRLSVEDATVAVDGLARRGGFAPADLLARRAAEPGARGCRRLDEIVELADPAAESPMETRLRLVLVRAGLPRPVLQYRLRNEYGVVVARFDLAYPQQRLAVEYDGRHHQWRALSADDRFRDGETGNLGWHTMRFTYDDVMLTRRRTAELVADQLRRRSPGSTPRR